MGWIDRGTEHEKDKRSERRLFWALRDVCFLKAESKDRK